MVGSILYAITAPNLVYCHRQAQFRLRVYFRVHTGLFLLPPIPLGLSARPASVKRKGQEDEKLFQKRIEKVKEINIEHYKE